MRCSNLLVLATAAGIVTANPVTFGPGTVVDLNNRAVVSQGLHDDGGNNGVGSKTKRDVINFGLHDDGSNNGVGSKTKRDVINFGLHDDDGNNGAATKIKRNGVTITDFGVRDLTGPKNNKRNSDYISSCGSTWMYVYDHALGMGYNSAVEAFCYHVTHSLDNLATTIGPGQYYSALVESGYLLTSGLPASVAFEIHNKMSDGNHTPNYNNCITYLQKMSAVDQSCYGTENIDTKGGTWQIGADLVSYHGLPSAQVD